MEQTGTVSPLLAPYKVLDLTDERGLIAGHLLAQMGADVVQVEPPQGSPARQAPPFDESNGHEGESLFWKAFAAGKRGISLALDTDAGRDQLLQLAKHADVLIESSGPGVMSGLGLGYSDLRAVNPRLVYVSISAYGSNGPKSGYADSDLTVWASAGPLALTRDPATGLPLRISIDQTFHQAATDAACGALMALLARGDDGDGQLVEVSAQASSTLCTLFGHLAASVNHEGYSMGDAGMKKKDDQNTTGEKRKTTKKDLDLSGSGSRSNKTKWDVKDGTIEMHIGIGSAAGRFSNALYAWLDEIGECPPDIAKWDWVAVPDLIEAGELTMEEVEDAREHAGEILKRYTKNEMIVIAEQKGLMLAPILTTADLIGNPQLLARDFLVPAGEKDLVRPAPFNGCGVDASDLRPEPALGEHNDEVLANWCGEKESA